MVKNSEKVRYASPEGSATWEYASAISCSSLIFTFGCVFGWSSPALARLMGPDAGTISATESELPLMATLCAMGYGLAPILTILMADKLGRKKSLLAISVPMMINWGLIAAAKDVSVLCIARFISGLSSGLGLGLAPMYLGEIASPKLRGALGMGIGIMTNAGGLFAYLIMPYMSLNTSGLVFLGISTLSLTTIWFIPESPYFLAIVGRLDEAEAALEKLRGKTDVSEELDLVKRTISHGEKPGGDTPEPRKSSAIKRLIGVPGNRRALCILLVFVFVLQFGGYMAITAFNHIIFQAIKAELSANVCATIVATIQLVFNILSALVVDRFGRKPLVCISGAISGACLLAVSFYFYLMEHTGMDVTSYSLLPVGAIFLNTAALSIGLMPLHLVTQSEILATEVKALVTLLVGMAGGLFATITCGLYLKVAMTWGLGHSVPFIAFFLITVTGTSIIVKMLPETKGKTFLEIQEDLNA